MEKKRLPKGIDPETLLPRPKYALDSLMMRMSQDIGDHIGRHNLPEPTYEWLLGCLNKLTYEQLKQPVQIFGPESGDLSRPALLKPAYSFGTVEELCHADGDVVQETRGPDFSHHPEQVILCVDGATFSDEGDTMYTMEDGGLRGNVTGKLFPFGSEKAVREPANWSFYGRMAWRTFHLERGRDVSFEEMDKRWESLPQVVRDVWTKVARTIALTAFPGLDPKP